MPNDFEDALASISYAYLQDKALKLIPNLIGFEVVEKNDENTKAIGLFAFKISNSYVYVPVFFSNGEVKPLELLYLKDKDMFVPLTDSWIDFLLKQKPLVLGEGEDNPLAVMRSTPNLEVFATPPMTGRYVTASAKENRSIDFLSEVEDSVKVAFTKELKNNRKFLEAVHKYLPMEAVKVALLKTKPLVKKSDETVKVVKVVDKDSVVDDVKALSSEEKKQVMSGKTVVQDNRAPEETSKLYDTQYTQKFQNPDESGVYHVINGDGNLFVGLVLINPKSFNALYSEPAAVVVDLDTDRYIIAPPSCIWVKNKMTIENLDKVWDKTISRDSGKIGERYLLLRKSGEDRRFIGASEPFRIMQVVKDSNGVMSYRVRPEKDIFGLSTTRYRGPLVTEISDYSSKKEDISYTSSETLSDEMYPKVVLSPKKYGDLYTLSNELIVPQEYDLLPLSGEEKNETDIGGPKFCLGKPGDVSYQLYNKNVGQVAVQSDGSEYIVKLNSRQTRPLKKKAALRVLCNKLGVAGQDALALVKEAEDKKVARRLIKVAQNYYADMQIPDPRIVANSGEVAPYMQFPDEQLMPLQHSYPPPPRMGMGENMYMGPGMGYPASPNMDISLAMQAANTGQKNVFDHALLGTLARTSQTVDLINSYLPDLQAAVDRLGRMIFLLWWRGEDFQDMFGISELQETEDTLRNVFRDLGDLSLDLKSKERVTIQ